MNRKTNDASAADSLSSDTCKALKLIIEPRAHDLGAFEVKRALPVGECRAVGSFVFFDHMGPAVLPPDQPVNVRPHPHIGLSTLTWMFDGCIMHRDSLGYQQEILPGEVNWMTAGSGIVHSERSPDRLENQDKPLHGLQTWMALPMEHEETAPAFQHYPADQLPRIQQDGKRMIVVAGRAFGETSPVAVFSGTLYVDITLEGGTELEIDSEHEERAIYLLNGEIELEGERFAPGRMLVLTPGVEATIRALEETHLVLIGGEKLDADRHIWWNFVSSSKARIEQAKEDWRDGKFGKVVDDEVEFIPLPND